MNGPRQEPDAITVPMGPLVAAYAVLAAAAVVWLWLRDRLGILGQQAIGSHGLVAALAAGAGVGLGVSVLSRGLARYLSPLRRLETALAEMIGVLDESRILTIALVSAVGEEVFFRCALQDAIGLWWSAVVFAVLHAGGVRYSHLLVVFAFGVAVGFGHMVASGLGLLSATVAHALINYLSLQRLCAGATSDR